MKKTVWGPLAVAAALSLLCAGQASAQSSTPRLPYNEFSVDYGVIKNKDNASSATQHSVGLSGRYLFDDNWFVTGSIGRAANEPSGVAYKNLQQAIGLGARYGLDPTTDLVATVGYTNQRETWSGRPGMNSNETAYGVGIRSLVTEDVELNAAISSNKPKQGGTYVAYNTGVGLHLSKVWVLRGSYSTSKFNGTTQDAYTFSVGYKF
jgi:hypothetical protein